MTNREIYAARDEFYDPQDAIQTKPGDLDEANHETEGAATFVVGLIVILLAACAGWWVAMSVGA